MLLNSFAQPTLLTTQNTHLNLKEFEVIIYYVLVVINNVFLKYSKRKLHSYCVIKMPWNENFYLKIGLEVYMEQRKY